MRIGGLTTFQRELEFCVSLFSIYCNPASAAIPLREIIEPFWKAWTGKQPQLRLRRRNIHAATGIGVGIDLG
jgi:hypothetical protein